MNPEPSKCYIHTPNLYQGDASWGSPYLEVSCDSLSSCPNGQEMRYPGDGSSAPSCVSAGDPTDGEFAGGASPPRQSSPNYVKKDCRGDSLDASITDKNDPNHCGILRYLVIFINVLSGLAGIAIAGSIIYGGIQYSAAGSDPQKVSAAKGRIRNAIIALIFFIFGYGILNWLVPGGVL